MKNLLLTYLFYFLQLAEVQFNTAQDGYAKKFAEAMARFADIPDQDVRARFAKVLMDTYQAKGGRHSIRQAAWGFILETCEDAVPFYTVYLNGSPVDVCLEGTKARDEYQALCAQMALPTEVQFYLADVR